MPSRWWRGTSRVTRSPAKLLNDARRTTALAERRAEPKGCGSLNNISVRTTQGGAEANDQGDLRTATTTRRTDPVHDPRDNSNTTNEQPTSSHHSFTPSIHTTHSHHPFTPPIHTINSHHPFTPPIHTSNSQHLFTPPIHTNRSQNLFTARIHITYSQHLFTPDVHTGATDRDEFPFRRQGGQDKPAHHGSAARRRTQPEKCGGKGQRACGPTGLRTSTGS